MPSINVNITAGADDGYQILSNGVSFANQYTRATLYIGQNAIGGGTHRAYIGAARFQTINIPQGATISSASLTIVKGTTAGSPSVKFYGNNVDNAAAWGVGNRVKNITKTAASTVADVSSATSVNDVKTIVQEIVNRGGWVANNALAFGGFNQHASTGANYWGVKAYEAGGSNIPNLSVTYSTGITFDASSNSGYQAASSSYSWSHTCTGADRYLTVGIAMLSLAQTVSSITYNSVALSLLGTKSSVSGAARVELWGLVAPSTGSNTISVILTGSIASAGCAASYAGIHQASPTEAFNSAQASNVGAADATVNVTTVADNDWCVDIVATDDTAITVGTGNTSRNNVTGVGGSGAMGDTNAAKTPAGSVTMSWTNIGALATWAIAAIALRPISASGNSRTSDFFAFFG